MVEMTDPFAHPMVVSMLQASARKAEAQWVLGRTQDQETRDKLKTVIARFGAQGFGYTDEFKVNPLTGGTHYQRWEIRNPVILVPFEQNGKPAVIFCDKATHRPLLTSAVSEEWLASRRALPGGFLEGLHSLTGRPDLGGGWDQREITVAFTAWEKGFVDHSALQRNPLGLIEELEAEPEGPYPAMQARAVVLGYARNIALTWCGERPTDLYDASAPGPIEGSDGPDGLLPLINPKDPTHLLVVKESTFEPVYALEKSEGLWTVMGSPTLSLEVNGARQATVHDVRRWKKWLEIEKRLSTDLESARARVRTIEREAERKHPLPTEALPPAQRQAQQEEETYRNRVALAITVGVVLAAIGFGLWKAGALDWARKSFAQADAGVA